MDDLEKGVIRTPLEPEQTYLDDPLRILRTIRFASRYLFQLEHSLLKAFHEEEVRNRFTAKISKERI